MIDEIRNAKTYGSVQEMLDDTEDPEMREFADEFRRRQAKPWNRVKKWFAVQSIVWEFRIKRWFERF